LVEAEVQEQLELLGRQELPEQQERQEQLEQLEQLEPPHRLELIM